MNVDDVIQFVRYAERVGYVVKVRDVPVDVARAACEADRLEMYAHPADIRWTCLRLTDAERHAPVT